MTSRIAISSVLAAAALLAVAGPLAAQDKPVVVANYYSMGDRAVDPMGTSIRAILTNVAGQGDFLEKKDVGALTEFYKRQGDAPSWITDGKFSKRALAVIDRIKAADTDGLNPADYRLPHFQIGMAQPAALKALARAEVMLSQAVIDYVHDAHSGRLDPADVSVNFNYAPHVADPVEALTKISMADDAPAVLASYNPQRPEFAALRDKLAEVRAAKNDLPPVIPAGANLKLGSKDPRVVTLRERLKIPPPEPPPAAMPDTPSVSAPAEKPATDAAAPAEKPATEAAAPADTATDVAVVPASAPAADEVTATVAVANAPAPAADPAATTDVASAPEVVAPPPFDPEVYDDSVVEAVKAYQKSAGLKPDGVVGPNTSGLAQFSRRRPCRYDHRQHGTLALDAGAPRRILCPREHPELQPRHLQERQGLLHDAHCRR